jgi:hypothetical protein
MLGGLAERQPNVFLHVYPPTVLISGKLRLVPIRAPGNGTVAHALALVGRPCGRALVKVISRFALLGVPGLQVGKSP